MPRSAHRRRLCLTWRLVSPLSLACYIMGLRYSTVGRIFHAWSLWQPFWRPSILIELELQTLLALWMLECPQAVVTIVMMLMLMLTVAVETRKIQVAMSRNHAIMKEAGMEIRPNESGFETASRVQAETLRIKTEFARQQAKADRQARAKQTASTTGMSAKKAKRLQKKL